MNVKICEKNAIRDAGEYASAVTKSVLTLARVLKITPKAFAEAVKDDDANAGFRAEFASALIPLFMKDEVEKVKEADK